MNTAWFFPRLRGIGAGTPVGLSTQSPYFSVTQQSQKNGTLVQSATNFTNATGVSTLTVSLPGVQAGDLIVGCCLWGTTGNASFLQTVSDGSTNAVTNDAINNSTNEQGVIFYWLAGKGGTVTYTATFVGSDGGADFPTITIMQFHSPVGATWATDGAQSGAGALNSGAVNTGNISPTAGLDIAVFFAKLYDVGATVSNPEINGQPAIATPSDAFAYYLPSVRPFTGAGTLTWSVPTNWVGIAQAFKQVT